jgi:hypothetical protein
VDGDRVYQLLGLPTPEHKPIVQEIAPARVAVASAGQSATAHPAHSSDRDVPATHRPGPDGSQPPGSNAAP